MKIPYRTTIDEIADVHVRLMGRSKAVARWKWQGMISTGFLAGLLVFSWIPEPVNVRMGFGTLGLIIGSALYWYWYPKGIYRRTRKYISEQLGKADGADFEIELRESGIWTKTNTSQLEFAWANVHSINEETKLIEFKMYDSGILVVQKRAFNDAKQIESFLETAVRLRGMSNNSNSTSGQAGGKND